MSILYFKHQFYEYHDIVYCVCITILILIHAWEYFCMF